MVLSSSLTLRVIKMRCKYLLIFSISLILFSVLFTTASKKNGHISSEIDDFSNVMMKNIPNWQSYGAAAATGVGHSSGGGGGGGTTYEYSVEPYGTGGHDNKGHGHTSGVISTPGAEFSPSFLKSVIYGVKAGLILGLLLGLIKLMTVGFPILSILLSLLFFLKGYSLGAGPMSLFPSLVAKLGAIATTAAPPTTVAPPPPQPAPIQGSIYGHTSPAKYPYYNNYVQDHYYY